MAGQPGGQDAVEHVDPERHGVEERDRVADPHQVARPVDRQLGQGGGQGGQQLLAGLAHRQPADAVAVEVEGGGRPGVLGPEVGVDPALDDAEQALLAIPVDGARPGGPGQGPGRGPADLLVGRGQAGADVEDHLDVGAQPGLDGHRRLGGQAVRGAVVDRPEGDAVVVDPGVEREHLEPAGVGEQMPVPTGEPVQAAEGLDHRPRPGRSIRW